MSISPSKRILIYCQCLLGMAPYVRTHALARHFLPHFYVDYIRGGWPYDSHISDSRFREIVLPPLMINDIGEEMFTPAEYGTRREAILKRIHIWYNSLAPAYDFFLSDLFPFGKLQLAPEITQIISQVKKRSPECKIICSLRDVMDFREEAFANKIVKLAKAYYDRIFVHADPRIVRLEDSFPLARELQDKIFYTGYIPNGSFRPKKRKKKILVSIGGGRFGGELAQAAASAADLFPDYQFIIILGPKSPEELRLSLIDLSKKKGYKNLEISSFLTNFPDVLASASLSISLGGYSLADIACTRTPALAYPLGFSDQFIRAQKFADKGFVILLKEGDLSRQPMASKIEEGLSMNYPSLEINMDGPKNTLEEILRISGN